MRVYLLYSTSYVSRIHIVYTHIVHLVKYKIIVKYKINKYESSPPSRFYIYSLSVDFFINKWIKDKRVICYFDIIVIL